MVGISKGLGKIEVGIKWDPAAIGAPAVDLDLIAATYRAGELHGPPGYLVHFGKRAPDGAITLDRDSKTGQGFGYDEVMTLELDRLAAAYARVVVGVVIQQRSGELAFGQVAGTGFRIREGRQTDLAVGDFTGLGSSTAATIAEFTREGTSPWEFHQTLLGFDADPDSFAAVMGGRAD